MNTIDTNEPTSSISNAPSPLVKNEGIKYGLILGGLATLILYGTYFADINIFVNATFWSTFIPYAILILIVAGLQLRKANGGLLAYKEALQFTFLSYAIAAVITAVATYILFNIIDKELTEKSFEIGMQKTQQFMEKMGAKEEDIEKAMTDARSKKQDTGFKPVFLGLGMELIFGFVKALLISLIIRKEKPAFGA